MTTSSELPREDASEFPPVIACAHCGRSDCEGCRPESAPSPEDEPSPLPWDQAPLGWSSFVQTALLTVERPDVSFGQLGQPRLGRAVLFAFLCEALAITSFFGVAAIAGFALFPRVMTNLLWSAQVLSWGLGLIAALSLGMVALHALWGEFLERGAQASGLSLDRRRGLQFGLYACGWDFLTSPFGMVGSGQRRGADFLAPVLAATRVPRRAMNHYLVDCRRATERQRKRALRHMTVLFLFSTIPIFLLALGLGVTLVLRALL